MLEIRWAETGLQMKKVGMGGIRQDENKREAITVTGSKSNPENQWGHEGLWKNNNWKKCVRRGRLLVVVKGTSTKGHGRLKKLIYVSFFIFYTPDLGAYLLTNVYRTRYAGKIVFDRNIYGIR